MLVATPGVDAQETDDVPTLDAYARVLDANGLRVREPGSNRAFVIQMARTRFGGSGRLRVLRSADDERMAADVSIPVCTIASAYVRPDGMVVLALHWACDLRGEYLEPPYTPAPQVYGMQLVDLFSGPEPRRVAGVTSRAAIDREVTRAAFWSGVDDAFVQRAVMDGLAALDRGDADELRRIRDGLVWRGELEVVAQLDAASVVRRAREHPAQALERLAAIVEPHRCDEAEALLTALMAGRRAAEASREEARVRALCAAGRRQAGGDAAFAHLADREIRGCWISDTARQSGLCFLEGGITRRLGGRGPGGGGGWAFAAEPSALPAEPRSRTSTVVLTDADGEETARFLVGAFGTREDGVQTMTVVDVSGSEVWVRAPDPAR